MTTWTAPDGIGSIELLETFGSDLTVVNAARVSFAKESAEITPADVKLIGYLAEHNHVTPFFHPQARFRIKMPIFVAREWFRHTVGLARNEVSRRYVDSTPECWCPSPDNIRQRDPRLKQGSRPDAIADADGVHAIMKAHMDSTVSLYESLLAQKVAPEIARCVLPQSMYTEFIETGSLAAFARLVGLRTGEDAQVEIRNYAAGLSELLTPRFPISWCQLVSA